MYADGRSAHGAYREGDSLLHRFDPRLKLVLMFGVMVCLFSAVTPLRLLLVSLLWFGLAFSCRNGVQGGLKVLGRMRWLLLFALLLHLFMTPGRTLFGLRWLSLDGLLRGVLVDVQLMLAVLFSLLLAWTTRPEALAWAFARLLSPLQKVHIPVQEAAGLLLLVLHFFPLIEVEASGLRKQAVPVGNSLLAKLKGVVDLVGPLLYRLVDRADGLSRDIVSGRESFRVDQAAMSIGVGRRDLVMFAAGLFLLLIVLVV